MFLLMSRCHLICSEKSNPTANLSAAIPKDFQVLLCAHRIVDTQICISLVEFSKRLLPRLRPDFFSRWVSVFGRRVIALSTKVCALFHSARFDSPVAHSECVVQALQLCPLHCRTHLVFQRSQSGRKLHARTRSSIYLTNTTRLSNSA